MAIHGLQEQLSAYTADRDRQVAIAGGRLAVNQAIWRQQAKLTFVRTDAPNLLSVSVGPDCSTYDYAVAIRSLDDMYEMAPEAVIGLIPDETRQRPDYWWIRNLLALREPTLTILVDSVTSEPPYTPDYDVTTIENLRARTYISSLAGAALYHEVDGIPVFGRAPVLGSLTPALVAA